jgi:hypothetical protein
MTKEEAIERMCRLMATVQAHLGWEHADCFCSDVEWLGIGQAIEWLEKLVAETIAKERSS